VAQGRPIYKYEPNNSNPDKAIGILLPFNKAADGRNDQQNYSSGSVGGGGVFDSSYSTEEQSISNLRNLLLTIKGERVMQPTFGTEIRASLFEPNTIELKETLDLSLREDIGKWLPYIKIDTIDIVSNINQYSISIRINYRVSEHGANRVIIILANENEILVESVPGELELQQVGSF